MPETIFLTERIPLVFKAARWLTGLAVERPLDLSYCAILVPTAGAGRRLRAELVKLAGESRRGLLAPLITTPMGLLSLAAGENVATRIDGWLAWTDVISRAKHERFRLLLSGFSDHGRSASRIGESLVELCSQLAEAGLTPRSSEIAAALPGQEDRWEELRSLYDQYLERLAGVGLEDPDVARVRAARTGLTPEGIRRVIVAGVSDLNGISQEYLSRLEAAGVGMAILVDAPECTGTHFNGWGRPDPQTWSETNVSLRLEDFHVAADPWSEAEVVAQALEKAPAGFCVADPAMIPFHDRAMRKYGLLPYDPAGMPLAPFECATLSRLWLSFSSTGRIAELRALAEHPVFLRWLGREADLSPTDMLSALDELETKILVETVDAAAGYIERTQPEKPRVAALIGAARRLRAKFAGSDTLGDLLAFLRAAYSQVRLPQASREGEALSTLASLLQAVRDSPLAKTGLDVGIFSEEMKNAAVFEPHGEGDIELNGWLEAPWLPQAALVVSGCTEGALPARIAAHPFLPDSARVALGLHNNAQRMARDAHLLHCLVATRRAGAIKLTLSRVGADGEPAKPSRLLFRCPDAELDARVKKAFGPVESRRTSHARERTWRLEIPQRPPPTTLRVTAFGDYLKSPLRFYLKYVLRMRRFESPKFEMDALDFGSVFHEALERFARDESVRDSSNPEEIETFVLAALDTILAEKLGDRLSLPLRVQRESLRARLRQFARIQAEQRQAGWRLRQGELSFKEENTLRIAGVPIVGTLDRVDVHEETGRRRILDYKTFARRISAAKKHLDTTPRQQAEWATVYQGKVAYWTDLQLPLYRALAEFLWPEDPEPPSVGYFLLPERVEESGIGELDLDQNLYLSAIASAASVADRIARGIFWPPGGEEYDDYVSLFLGEDPAEVVSEASRDFLMGTKALEVVA